MAHAPDVLTIEREDDDPLETLIETAIRVRNFLRTLGPDKAQPFPRTLAALAAQLDTALEPYGEETNTGPIIPEGDARPIQRLNPTIARTLDTGSMVRAKLSDGTATILHATYIARPCGCAVTGDGTLQNPLSVEPCRAHGS